MTLHLSQMGLTDGLTFMCVPLSQHVFNLLKIMQEYCLIFSRNVRFCLRQCSWELPEIRSRLPPAKQSISLKTLTALNTSKLRLNIIDAIYGWFKDWVYALFSLQDGTNVFPDGFHGAVGINACHLALFGIVGNNGCGVGIIFFQTHLEAFFVVVCTAG